MAVIGMTAMSLFAEPETEVASNSEGETTGPSGDLNSKSDALSNNGGLSGFGFGQGVKEDRKPQRPTTAPENKVNALSGQDRTGNVSDFNAGVRNRSRPGSSEVNPESGGGSGGVDPNSVDSVDPSVTDAGGSSTQSPSSTPTNNGIVIEIPGASSGSTQNGAPKGPQDIAVKSNSGLPQNPSDNKRPGMQRAGGVNTVPLDTPVQPSQVGTGDGNSEKSIPNDRVGSGAKDSFVPTRPSEPRNNEAPGNRSGSSSEPDSPGVFDDVDEDAILVEIDENNSDVVYANGESFEDSDEDGVDQTFFTNEGTIRTISKTRNGEYLAVVTREGSVFVFDQADGSLMYQTKDSRVRRAYFSDDPEYLFTISDRNDGSSVDIRSVATGAIHSGLMGSSGRKPASVLAVSENGRSAFASWSGKEGCHFWRVDALREYADRYELKGLFGSDRYPLAAGFTTNERVVVIAFTDGTLMSATSDGKRFVKENETEVHTGRITAFATFHESNSVVTGGQDGNVFLTELGKEEWTKKQIGKNGDDVLSVAVSDNDSLIAVARADMTIVIYRSAGLRKVATLKTNKLCTAMEFIEDGDRIVVGLQDGNVQVLPIKNR